MNSAKFCGLSSIDTNTRTSDIFKYVNSGAFICTRLDGNARLTH